MADQVQVQKSGPDAPSLVVTPQPTIARSKALELAQERVAHFNKAFNFRFNNINIKNQKTRWGSCSRKGNLNFNYKIALLPQRLSDYIIVHELCHLGQFNHSQKFWNLVARAMPDYLDIRKELRENKVNFFFIS